MAQDWSELGGHGSVGLRTGDPRILPGRWTQNADRLFFRLQPPVQLQGLAGKYAGALFSAAVKKDEKTLSAVEKDVTAIKRVIEAKDGQPL